MQVSRMKNGRQRDSWKTDRFMRDCRQINPIHKYFFTMLQNVTKIKTKFQEVK